MCIYSKLMISSFEKYFCYLNPFWFLSLSKMVDGLSLVSGEKV
jgi:hypothetical protein